ncbi:peptidase S8/S53 domain-containing protein [Phaeosphaeriaceae sp. PMI808]|nr:peptidase S8/S53 domain-containing protein [Phaeosphaeriaceae sp. PMI808]
MRFFIFLSILAPAVVSTILSDTMIRDLSIAQLEPPDQSSRLENRDAGTTYMAWATKPKNDNELLETRKFLNDTVVDRNHFITSFKARDGSSFVWGGLTLDAGALQKVKAYSKLKDVMVEPKVKKHLAISRKEEEEIPEWYGTKVKRTPSDWTKQDPAPKNLALVNVEKKANPKDYSAFVYEKKAGDGTFIYVIEEGIAYNVEYAKDQREFPKGKVFPLQTDGSKNASPAQKEDADDDAVAPSHGTKVASVALGQRFGVAKKATLISVKTTSKAVDNLAAFELVYTDIAIKNPTRAKKSIVNVSWTLGNSANIQSELRKAIEPLLNIGVPVVVASGNQRKSSDSSDEAPATLYAPDFPIIVVGGTDPNGNRDSFSQGKRANAVHAPGSQIDVSNKDGTKAQDKGTSFAAPAVCGLIATYMAYDTIPWDEKKTNKGRVTEIRNYLRSDKSSVARGSDPIVRTIWNGVPKSDYDQVVISALKPSKGWFLSIAMVSNVNSHSGGADVSRAWKFYTAKVGKPVGSCGETDGQEISAQSNDKPAGNSDIDNPPWPGGSFKLNIEGEACEYKCDGTNPGRLFCPAKQISCWEDSMKSKKEGTLKCGDRTLFHPVVYCDF